MLHRLLILMIISFNVYAKNTQQIDLEDIEISVIGDSNQSHIAIGTPQNSNADKTTIHCKNIKKLIIGQHSSVQLSLPDNFSSVCEETHQ